MLNFIFTRLHIIYILPPPNGFANDDNSPVQQLLRNPGSSRYTWTRGRRMLEGSSRSTVRTPCNQFDRLAVAVMKSGEIMGRMPRRMLCDFLPSVASVDARVPGRCSHIQILDLGMRVRDGLLLKPRTWRSNVLRNTPLISTHHYTTETSTYPEVNSSFVIYFLVIC